MISSFRVVGNYVKKDIRIDSNGDLSRVYLDVEYNSFSLRFDALDKESPIAYKVLVLINK